MNIALIVAGIICLAASGVTLYVLTPREGRPPSRVLNSEFGSMSITLGVLVAAIIGASLIMKGIYS
jgi:hypothetical protein